LAAEVAATPDRPLRAVPGLGLGTCFQVLRKLEAKGLIRRETDAADTRAKRLRATGRGAELARQAIAAVEAADAKFFQPIPDPGTLLTVLRPLAGRGDH
jgi:DNA-binding MarR family transcriptional regulator